MFQLEQGSAREKRRANMSELLNFVLQAHGGLERWREVQSLDIRVSLTGGLYQLKGYPEGVPNVTMRVRRSVYVGRAVAISEAR
jgi:hypothetical protein